MGKKESNPPAPFGRETGKDTIREGVNKQENFARNEETVIITGKARPKPPPAPPKPPKK